MFNTNMTKEEFEKLVEKAKKMEVYEQKSKDWYQRNTAKQKILMRKAKEAGIEVSEKEIDEYLNMKK